MKLTLKKSRAPNGWAIGCRAHPPYWSYWNLNGDWAGSGHIFSDAREATAVMNLLSELIALKLAAKELSP